SERYNGHARARGSSIPFLSARSLALQDINVHVVQVTQNFIVRIRCLKVMPLSAKTVGAPELIVEDHVLDVQVLPMSNQPVCQLPSGTPVFFGYRTKENING